MADDQPQTPPDKQLVLQRIYIKDLSFESPKAPHVFQSNAAPHSQVNIRTSNKELDEGNVEVTLTLTLESKVQEETLFIIELSQSGVFYMQGYTEEERSMILGSFCPNTLYPFAREAIADIAMRGGFPQLLLQPINFDAMYQQAVSERAAAQGVNLAQAEQGPMPDGQAKTPPSDGEAH